MLFLKSKIILLNTKRETMKQMEKIAVAAGIILVLYFVMKDDKDKDKKGKYEYQRREKAKGGQFAPWERKGGSRSGS